MVDRPDPQPRGLGRRRYSTTSARPGGPVPRRDGPSLQLRAPASTITTTISFSDQANPRAHSRSPSEQKSPTPDLGSVLLLRTSTLGLAAGLATERKPRMSASEFRFGLIVSSGPASRIDASSVSARCGASVGDLEMLVASTKQERREFGARAVGTPQQQHSGRSLLHPPPTSIR